jgi:hypothetical protein
MTEIFDRADPLHDIARFSNTERVEAPLLP